jgi:hypothetical protein
MDNRQFFVLILCYLLYNYATIFSICHYVCEILIPCCLAFCLFGWDNTKGWQRIRRKTPKSKLSLKELLTTKVSDQQKDLQFTAFYEKAGKGTVYMRRVGLCVHCAVLLFSSRV